MSDRKRVVILPRGGRLIVEDVPLSDAAQDAVDQGLAQEEYDEEHPRCEWPEYDPDED